MGELKPGMHLYSMAITEDGRAILRAGTVLDELAIKGLKIWGIYQVEILEDDQIAVQQTPRQYNCVKIEDEENIDRVLSDKMPALGLGDEKLAKGRMPVDEQPPFNSKHVASAMSEKFEKTYQNALLEVKNEMTKARFLQDSFSMEKMKSIIMQFLHPLLNDPIIFWKLQFIEQTEDYLYHHSVDVAILAGCISSWLGCSVELQQKLMWGGLLHDIGKTLVPLKVINKSGALNLDEWDVAKSHTTRGYRFLKKKFDVPREILYCVLQHHERMDGTGYPLAVKSDKIDIGARVIAVADVFSAMTSSRSYGKIATTYDAAETLHSDMFDKLDPQICSLFLYKLRQCFQANRVYLSDGSFAEVIFLNDTDDARPIVRTDAGMIIDLNHSRDLRIQKVMN